MNTIRFILAIFLLCLVSLAHGQTYGGGSIRNRAYQAESIALFARLSPTPNILDKYAMDSVIYTLKRDTVYTGVECIYDFTQSSRTNIKQNWIKNTYNLTEVGTNDWVSNRWTQNHVAANYWNTGFNPSLDTVPCGINKVGMTVVVGNENYNTTVNSVIGAVITSTFAIYTTQTAIIGRFNGASGTTTTTSAKSFIYTAQRVLPNRTEAYLDGVFNNAGISATTTIPNGSLFIGCRNTTTGGTPGQYTLSQIKFVIIHRNLTSTQVMKVRNILTWYLSRKGAIAFNMFNEYNYPRPFESFAYYNLNLAA